MATTYDEMIGYLEEAGLEPKRVEGGQGLDGLAFAYEDRVLFIASQGEGQLIQFFETSRYEIPKGVYTGEQVALILACLLDTQEQSPGLQWRYDVFTGKIHAFVNLLLDDANLTKGQFLSALSTLINSMNHNEAIMDVMAVDS